MNDKQPSQEESSAGGPEPTRVVLEQALAAPPAALAVSFLSVKYNLHFARLAAQGSIKDFVTTIDGPAYEIGEGNATDYVSAFEERLAIYTRAIETRGFEQLDTAFDAASSESPGQTAPALLQQDRFSISLCVIGGKKYSGVIVESTLFLEDTEDPDVKVFGQVADGLISLEFSHSGNLAATATLQPRAQLDSSFALAYAVRALTWCKEGEYANALEDVHEALRIDKGCVMALLVHAQILATAPEARFRDGLKAVQLATQVCELAGWQEWSFIHALAAAYAEAEDFDQAVAWEARALEIAPPDCADFLRERIGQFRSHRPFRAELGAW